MSAVGDLARAFCRDREHVSITWAGQPCSDCREGAEDSLTKLHALGWRIVRTGEDGIRHGSKPHVAIFEEWRP